MGSHPHQYIMYGIACTDYDKVCELNDGVDVDLFKFCEENGVDFEFGGNAQDNVVNDLVIGIKYAYHNGEYRVDDFAGYQSHHLNVADMTDWLDYAKGKMTPELVASLQEVLGVTDKPALWTVANYG